MQLFIMMQVLHIKLSGVGCCSDYTRKPDFNITLATIFILRMDIEVGWGGGVRKWQFSLTLSTENVLTWGGGGKKKPKRNRNMVPYGSFVITDYTVLHKLELPSTRHYQNCSV